GVDGDGRLARLAVADDQLALAAADGDHGIDGLDARLQWFLHRFAGHDAGRLHLDLAGQLGGDGTFAVDGLPERIDHPAHRLGAHADLGDLAGALDGVAFAHVAELAYDGDAHVVLFQ